MITEDTMMYLKEKYNGHKIIYVRFSNEEFIFRTLSKKEYKVIPKPLVFENRDILVSVT